MVYEFFDIKNSGAAVKNEIISNKELAEDYANQLIENLGKKYTHFYRQYLGCISSRYSVDR